MDRDTFIRNNQVSNLKRYTPVLSELITFIIRDKTAIPFQTDKNIHYLHRIIQLQCDFQCQGF